MGRIAIAWIVAVLGTACLETPDAAEPTCPDNLLANGTFDTGTADWTPFGATVERINGRTSDAVRVCWDEVDEEGVDFRSSMVGIGAADRVEQRLTAWVRAEVGHEPITLAVYGLDDGGGEQLAYEGATPDAEWQEAGVTITPDADVVNLGVYLRIRTPLEAPCFELDDVCLAPREP